MGLLRKLAELVVEFPPEEQKAAPAGSGDDVLASIEQIRQNMEHDIATRPSFKEPAAEALATSSSTQPAGHGKLRVPPALAVADIYAKAKLSTPDGFDVFHVEKMLNDPEIADLPLETRAKSVRMALRSQGRELEDVIADAAMRDQALEAYHQFLVEAVNEVAGSAQAQNDALQQEIDSFVAAKREQMTINKDVEQRARQSLSDFLRTKAAEEQRLFGIVAPFVAPGKNPVQLTGDDKHRGEK
jgi:hypothetical protein